MANEIQAQAATGKTLYAVVINSVGQIWNGSAFATIAGASWASYDIALTEAAAGIYLGNMPAVAAGLYTIVVYERAGGAPATTDSQVDSGTLDWNGSAVVAEGAGSYYGTLARLRAEHLTQVPTGATNDALLIQMLQTATALVDSALGFSFSAYGAATAKDVRGAGAGADTWAIPPHEIASVTTVFEVSGKGTTSESTTAVTEFAELDDGRLYYGAGWSNGPWYRITAEWGYGPAPEEIVKITMQRAVDLWNDRMARSSADSVGVDGPGSAPAQRAWTWLQYQTIQAARRDAGEFGIA